MHVDAELLSLIALGEPVGDADDHSHVRTCPECAGELAELRRLVDVGRSVEAAAMAEPGPHVWTRISEELGFTAAGAESDPDRVHQDREHPRRTLLAAIKAALAGPTASSLGGPVAHATLAPVQTSWSGASGEAVLATDDLDRRILQVAIEADLPSSGVRHAWLVHRDDPTVRQSLGILDGSYGVWTVDKAIDLEEFGFLDISQQDLGETEHSGHTIVRGELALVG